MTWQGAQLYPHMSPRLCWPNIHLRLPPAGHVSVHRTPLLSSRGRSSSSSSSSSSGRSPPAATPGQEAGQGGLKPNALVAHLEEGLEAIHLYTGRGPMFGRGSGGASYRRGAPCSGCPNLNPPCLHLSPRTWAR
jgi:hypothetical protein